MSEFILNDPKSIAQFRHRGADFVCSCGGRLFSMWHRHNPYGDDMCPRTLRCAECGLEWDAGYSGSPRYERVT